MTCELEAILNVQLFSLSHSGRQEGPHLLPSNWKRFNKQDFIKLHIFFRIYMRFYYKRTLAISGIYFSKKKKMLQNNLKWSIKEFMLEMYQYIWLASIIINIIYFFLLWDISKMKIFLFVLGVRVNNTECHKMCIDLKTKLKNSLEQMQWPKMRIIWNTKFTVVCLWLSWAVKSLLSIQWIIVWLVDSVLATILNILIIIRGKKKSHLHKKQ